MKRFLLVTALAAVITIGIYFPAAELLKMHNGKLLYFSEYFNNITMKDRQDIPRNYGNASIASAGIFSIIMIINILVELRKGKKK